jgi:hypothetical protein
MNLLKSRRLILSILAFALTCYYVNAGSVQLNVTIKEFQNLIIPISPDHILATLFTRLEEKHISTQPEDEGKVKLEKDEITKLVQVTGLFEEKIEWALILANGLRQNGQRDRENTESKARTILGEDLYNSLEDYTANSSFNRLVEFIKSAKFPFSIRIPSTQ